MLYYNLLFHCTILIRPFKSLHVQVPVSIFQIHNIPSYGYSILYILRTAYRSKPNPFSASLKIYRKMIFADHSLTCSLKE